MLKLTKSTCEKVESLKKTLQDDYDCLDKSFKTLKVKYESLKENNSSLNAIAPVTSSIDDCIKCKNIDIKAYATNAKTIQVLTSQNDKLKSLLYDGFLKCHKGSKALNEVLGA